jgi:hypothetical protein
MLPNALLKLAATISASVAEGGARLPAALPHLRATGPPRRRRGRRVMTARRGMAGTIALAGLTAENVGEVCAVYARHGVAFDPALSRRRAPLTLARGAPADAATDPWRVG